MPVEMTELPLSPTLSEDVKDTLPLDKTPVPLVNLISPPSALVDIPPPIVTSPPTDDDCPADNEMEPDD